MPTAMSFPRTRESRFLPFARAPTWKVGHPTRFPLYGTRIGSSHKRDDRLWPAPPHTCLRPCHSLERGNPGFFRSRGLPPERWGTPRAFFRTAGELGHCVKAISVYDPLRLTHAHRHVIPSNEGIPVSSVRVGPVSHLKGGAPHALSALRHLTLVNAAINMGTDNSTCHGYCRSGETGRRRGLKIPRWQHHVGSSPTSGIHRL